MPAQADAYPRFKIYQGTTLLGGSALESNDPPMGVAWGQFIAAPAYAALQEQVRALTGGADQSSLQLQVYHLDQPVPAMGVSLQDYSAECGAEAIEISVLGIGYPLYEQLFPHAVAAYLKAPG
ncbi:hypothetical protein K5F93_27140 [Pseudomonas protegens]|uniref:hypothetical protein n=1 Tax=Pseudomonas protegens TaxID=380021 RepID=UPI001C8E1E87|nr:hypothetical protein [Pseudomonas protegens]QZI69985.1 hypothetical protein K5F93_27140 [Pseudomonas protegens]